jgi:hypothetical protein
MAAVTEHFSVRRVNTSDGPRYWTVRRQTCKDVEYGLCPLGYATHEEAERAAHAAEDRLQAMLACCTVCDRRCVDPLCAGTLCDACLVEED